MKGKKCFGLLLVLFTMVGLLLSVCSDASALTITADGTPTGVKYNFNDVYYYYTSNEGQTWTLDNQQKGNLRWMETTTTGQRRFFHAIKPNKQIHITKDYYYALEFAYQWSWLGDQNAFHEIFIYSHYANPNDFNVMSWEQGECHSNTSYDPSITTQPSTWYGENTQIYTCYDYIVLQATHDGDIYFQLGSGNALFAVALTPFRGTFRIGEITELKPTVDGAQELNEKDDQDRQDIENQSSDNQDQADDAGDEADQTGQTLMQAFGSLITALTSVHETSCTLPNMSVYSLDLNNIDLCAVGLPSGIAALVGIGMCLIIVPLGIHLVKKMISLYKEIVG